MNRATDILEKVKTTDDLMNLTKNELIDYALAVTIERNSLRNELDFYKREEEKEK